MTAATEPPTVTCWWACLHSADIRLKTLLRPADSTRIQQFTQPSDRGRRMVAQVLVDALAPDSTRLCPECASRSHGAVVARSRFVSVSHARSLVVVAVSDWPVGIDVDHAGDIRGTTGATNPHLWTRREAVVKLRGIRDATATLACAGVSVCPWPQHAVATAGQVATTDLVIPAGRGTGRYAASVAWPTSGTTPAHSSMTVVHRDGDRLIARLLGKQQTAP